MKNIIKYSNHFGFILALCVTTIYGSSCSTTKQDPLVGWQKIYNRDLDPAIVNDWHDYIQNLPPEERNYVGPYFYFEDGKGQQAVTFEIDKYGKDVWNFYLFYDQNNKRIKIEKIQRGKYWNP